MRESSVLLIPSDEFNWRGLECAVWSMNGIRVVGETTDAAKAAQIVGMDVTDLILMTDSPKETSLVPLLERLRHCCPVIKLVVLASDIPDEVAVEAMAALDVTACVLWRDLKPTMLEYFLLLVLGIPCRITSEAVAAVFLAAVSVHPRQRVR